MSAPASLRGPLLPLIVRNPLHVSGGGGGVNEGGVKMIGSLPAFPPAAGAPSAAKAHLASLLQQVGSLRAQVEAFQQAKLDSIDWRSTGYTEQEVNRGGYGLVVRSRLCGKHVGRATALCWAGDNTTLVSVGTDGMVLLWNAMKEEVDGAAQLPAEDVPTCVDVEHNRENEGLVVVGGLNQVCHVYLQERLREATGGECKPQVTLPPAGACLTCVRVLEHDRRVLMGSADGLLRSWDLTTNSITGIVDGRGGPVTCAKVMPQDSDVCASGYADGRVRVWDMRLADERACVLSFGGFSGGGVSALDFFPAGTAVAAGGADSSVRLFDLRACGPVGVYCDPRKRVGVTGLAFSRSGLLLFAAYDDPVCLAWEPMSADGAFFDMVGDLVKPVHCLASNGLAVAVGSELDDRVAPEIIVWA